MNTLLWELVRAVSKVIGICGEMERMPMSADATPEDRATADTMHKILAAERDHLKALEYLYAQMTKEKPASEITEYAKTTLAEFRDQAKLIK